MTTIEKIVRLLKSRGHTQESFEAQCGLAKGRITKWLEGQGEPKASQIWRISRELAIDVAYLLDEDRQETPLAVGDKWEQPMSLVRYLGVEESMRRLTQSDSRPGDMPIHGRQVVDVATRHKGSA